MPHCAVKTCKNSSQKNKSQKVKYFSFPKNEMIAQAWVKACGIKKVNMKHARVCSDHFLSSCFMISMMHRLLNYCPMKARILKPDAVPTENLPEPVISSSIPNKSPIKSNCCVLPQSDKKSVRKTGLFKIDIVKEMNAQDQSLVQKKKYPNERTPEDYQAEINELKGKLETANKIIHIYQTEMKNLEDIVIEMYKTPD